MKDPNAGYPHAPSFRLRDDQGKWVSLEDFTSRGPVMLVFYPGDFTPVCTQQLCSYQAAQDEFRKFGIQTVGISADPVESHVRFKEEKKLEIPLLSDPNKEAFRAYGAGSKLLLGTKGRAVFIVSKEGRIVYRKVEAIPITHRKADELEKILAELKQANRI